MDIPNIKEIFELIKRGATIEAQQRIIELKENMISLQEDNLKLREENLSMKQQLEVWEKGERCPKCRKGIWNLIESKPHPIFGQTGVLERKYQCSECGFAENQKYNPSSRNK